MRLRHRIALWRLKLYVALRDKLAHKVDFHLGFVDISKAIAPELVARELTNPYHNFESINGNIGGTIKFLKQVLPLLDKQVNVAPVLATSKILPTTTNAFFVSAEGFYLDAQASLSELKELLQQYAEFINTHKDTEAGYTAHNVRILKPTTEALHQLAHNVVRYLITT